MADNIQETDYSKWVIIAIALTIIATIIISIIIALLTKEKKENSPQKNNTTKIGCLIVVSILLIAGIITVTVLARSTQKENTTNESETKFMTRKASISDITINEDKLDLASLGEKLTFTPKKDIEDLKLKFVFQKASGANLQTIEKTFGNVKEGQQYSVTISLVELNWDVIKNAFDVQCKYTVSSGTISYFA